MLEKYYTDIKVTTTIMLGYFPLQELSIILESRVFKITIYKVDEDNLQLGRILKTENMLKSMIYPIKRRKRY